MRQIENTITATTFSEAVAPLKAKIESMARDLIASNYAQDYRFAALSV